MLPEIADSGAWDCHACRNDFPGNSTYQTEDTRRSWHCGWMSPEEWTDYTLDLTFDGLRFAEHCGDMCPGYMLTLPQIQEAAQAADAFRNNALPLLFPGLERCVVEAAQELKHAWSRYEAKVAERQRQQTPST